MERLTNNETKGVDVERRGKLSIVRFLDANLNFYVTGGLKDHLKEKLFAEIDAGCDRFVLSLVNVKCIDSCGVGLVIVANNVTAAKGAKLYLSDVKPFIRKIFDIMRISKHLSIFDTEDEAVAAADKEQETDA